jgi:hypothetical protein
VFAQDPLFEQDGTPNENYRALEGAAKQSSVSAIGSAPYVEKTVEASRANIAYILHLAQEHQLMVDLHLDYNLDSSTKPLIYDVLAQIKSRGWDAFETRPGYVPTITIGHATRLSLMSSDEWKALKTQMKGLPVYFVGLPQSDLYMMGRTTDSTMAPRGTLNILRLKNEHGMRVSLSVNNVQNPFTPQGSVDPLSLCTLGVAVFQSAVPEDCCTLLVCAMRTP